MNFFIVTACRNSRNIERCIKSVLSQSKQFWRMVIVDDCSTDDTYDRATKAAKEDPRITIIKNSKRKYALQNIVESVWQYAGQDDVVVTLDGDDWLSDDQALAEIEAEYHRTQADAIWTKYQNEDGTPGISRKMTGDPISCGWTMSHLRTFKKYLIHGIRPEVFTDENGKWWRCAYDQAMYRPILKVAKKAHHFERVCMIYSPGQGDNKQTKQIETAEKIGKRLKHEFRNYSTKNVLFIVNGKSEGCDPRFHQGERRHPLGVLTLAATLEARGHNVALLDRFASPGTWPKPIIQWATHIGVSCTTPNFADALTVLKMLQRYRKKKVIMAGGPHVVLHPESVKEWCDLVSVSEADHEIIDMVENGTASPDKGRICNLDSVPLPSYRLAMDSPWQYTSGWDYDNTQKIVPMNTSRSCPHDCSFCDVKNIWGKTWIARSAERVIEDVRYVLRTTGAGGIYFREDNFCCSKKRITAICEGLIREGIKTKWACEMRADTGTDAKLMHLMADAGCVGIYIGAESGSDRMLKIYRKGITRQQIVDTCANAHVSGINVLMSIIEKHHEETPEDKYLTKTMIDLCKPKRVNVCEYRED